MKMAWPRTISESEFLRTLLLGLCLKAFEPVGLFCNEEMEASCQPKGMIGNCAKVAYADYDDIDHEILIALIVYFLEICWS